MKKLLIVACILFLTVTSLIGQTNTEWTLANCIQYAFEQNIRIRKSILSTEIAGINAEQAKARRFPSLNAAVSQDFSWSKSDAQTSTAQTSSNGTNYSLNSGVTLFNYSRISNLIKQAELYVQGEQYSLEATRESISLNILNAFLQVLYAEEQVKNSEKQIESTGSQLFLAEERLALKEISRADYALVKSQLASEKLNLANAESQLAITKVNLMQLMELPVTEGFEISHPDLGDNINENRTPDVVAIYETALAIKPQIKNAGVDKQIAALDADIARAGYYPVLSASAGIAYLYSNINSDLYSNQIDNGIKPHVGLSLTIPIFQRKEVKTSVAISRINLQNAVLDETDTMNQLRKDIEQACQDVISAQIKYEANIQNYIATNESSELSDEKFSQGLINTVDYLVRKTNLIVAESQLLQSKYNLIFSYKILDFYTGVPLTL